LKAQVEGLVNQKLMEIQGVGVEVLIKKCWTEYIYIESFYFQKEIKLINPMISVSLI